MRKFIIRLTAVSIVIFVITWGIIGIKILDHNYMFITEAYIAYGSLIVFFGCLMYLRFTNRCPYCGKIKQQYGKYCPYCGKELRD